MKYLFSNFLLVSRYVLDSKLGMFDTNEEGIAEKVWEATTVLAESWFPRQGPPIPTVELCVELNNLMAYIHNVMTPEDRTSSGFPSGGSWNSDCWKIINSKVPIRFPSESDVDSMLLPSLNSGATEAWTQCALLTPHHLDKDDRGRGATFYGKDELSSEDV